MNTEFPLSREEWYELAVGAIDDFLSLDPMDERGTYGKLENAYKYLDELELGKGEPV